MSIVYSPPEYDPRHVTQLRRAVDNAVDKAFIPFSLATSDLARQPCGGLGYSFDPV